MPNPSRFASLATRAGRTPAYNAATFAPRLWPTRFSRPYGFYLAQQKIQVGDVVGNQ